MIDKERDLLEQLMPLNSQELFYKKYYQAKQSQETYDSFLSSRPSKLKDSSVALLNTKEAKSIQFAEANTFFKTQEANICVYPHNRYSLSLRHKHTFFELMYVLNGKVNNIFDNTSLVLTTRDICIVSPGSYHVVNITDDDSILINILIRSSTFYETFTDILSFNNVLADYFTRTLYMNYANEYILFRTKGDIALAAQFDLLIKEGLCQDEYSDKLMKALLVSCFIYILRNHAHLVEISDAMNPRLMTAANIIGYIQRFYSEVNLKTVSEHFNYSPQYISKLIKEITGKTFSAILQEIRLSHACIMLKSTNQTMASICERVGYNNLEHFHRIFKQAKGVTPNSYRMK